LLIKNKFNFLFKILLSKRFYKGMPKRIVIQKPILISKGINFKDRISIGNSARIELVQNSNSTRMPNLVIGENVNIEQDLHMTCGEEIIIGENTAILPRVCITDIDHPYIDINTPPKLQPLVTKKVSIGNNCMIGINSVILSGTKIGNHSIVGANSVVRGEFPDYCVIAGAPAKVVRIYDKKSNKWINV